MFSRFERFMALRYLSGAEGRTEGRSFLRFVTYVAVGGVALGVAALLLSLAIVRGFSQEITDKIIGFGAHIQVRSYFQDRPLTDASSLQSTIAATDGVTTAVPRIEDIVLLRRSEQSIDGVRLLGTNEPPRYLREHMIEGRFNASASTTQPSLVVGAGLADRLGLRVGQTVTAFSLRGQEGGGNLQLRRPRVKQFRITGIYDTSLSDIDDNFIFTDLKTARRLVGMPAGSVTRFDVTVRDFSAVDTVASQIEGKVGFPATARTIHQLQPFSSLFAWVDLQQGIIPLVIGVIVVVGAFNIVGALLMMILEKTREIGVLQSLGTSQRALKRLFLTLGLLIGAVGTTIGAGLALALGYLQQQFEIIPLPAQAYYMNTAPIELNPLDYVVVSAVTLALCGLAAYIPARVAARVEPVQAIRFQ
ncbi:MAG TPA: ABC transporter permease [Salinibacter sp.]|nr:ABC transporter permease [Salinibacter sp.]